MTVIVNLVSSSTMSCYSLQKNGPGAPGGQSWTVEWLRFDNSYFKVRAFCHILHAEKLIRVHHLSSGSNTSGYQRETRSRSSGPTYRCCFIWGPKVQGDLMINCMMFVSYEINCWAYCMRIHNTTRSMRRNMQRTKTRSSETTPRLMLNWAIWVRSSNRRRLVLTFLYSVFLQVHFALH